MTSTWGLLLFRWPIWIPRLGLRIGCRAAALLWMLLKAIRCLGLQRSAKYLSHFLFFIFVLDLFSYHSHVHPMLHRCCLSLSVTELQKDIILLNYTRVNRETRLTLVLGIDLWDLHKDRLELILVKDDHSWLWLLTKLYEIYRKVFIIVVIVRLKFNLFWLEDVSNEAHVLVLYGEAIVFYPCLELVQFLPTHVNQDSDITVHCVAEVPLVLASRLLKHWPFKLFETLCGSLV